MLCVFIFAECHHKSQCLTPWYFRLALHVHVNASSRLTNPGITYNPEPRPFISIVPHVNLYHTVNTVADFPNAFLRLSEVNYRIAWIQTSWQGDDFTKRHPIRIQTFTHWWCANALRQVCYCCKCFNAQTSGTGGKKKYFEEEMPPCPEGRW